MTSQCQKKVILLLLLVTENGAEIEYFHAMVGRQGVKVTFFRHFLLLVSVVFLLVSSVLSSSEAEEPGEDGDEDEHTHSNTDDDVQGAVV